jgi:hypothetical protein
MIKILLYDTGDVRGEFNEPIGIELLAANAIAEFSDQISIDLKWYNFDRYSFDMQQYDIIGISIHINGLDIFENIYRLLRNQGGTGFLIAGNSVSTFAYEYLLNQHPEVICSIGEGEDTFCKIIDGYIKGSLNLSCIPNLAYIDKNNQLKITERTTCDMNKYLPPIRVFNRQLLEHKGIARIEASRGCSWNKCNFCGTSHKYNDVGWRPIDIGVIIRQLIELSKDGFTTVYFCDEDFIGSNIKRFSELVDHIRDKMDIGEISPAIKFFISIKPPDIVNENNIEIIKRFKQCGLKELFVGLESGCENQLKRYNKCTNVKINSLAANRIRELADDDLTIDIGFIFFDINMTPADIEENICFIESNKLYTLASSLIKPIRIQPFTRTFEYASGIHENEFSPDDLMYSYRFADDIVESVYTAYSELMLETIAHEIQSVYRRELSSKTGRKSVERNLVELRFLQFTAIKFIAAYYIQKNIELHDLKNKLDDIVTRAKSLILDS